MPDNSGKMVLLRLKRLWTLQQLLIALLVAAACSLVAGMLSYVLFALPFYWVFPLLVLVFISYSLVNRWWTTSERDVARWLNQSEPALQESTELVLLPTEALSGLQRLQQEKVQAALKQLKPLYPYRKATLKALAFLGVSAGLSCVMFYFSGNRPQQLLKNIATTVANPNKTVLPPQIKSLRLSIIPPAYTGKAVRTQPQPDVQIEEGGTVKWSIETSGKPEKLELLFNDGTVVPMLASKPQATLFTAQKVILKSGFYQIKMGDTLSGLYKLELITDKAPTVVIQKPQPASTIAFGQSTNVLLQALVSDDYGIQSASISATISSGEGEAVKFKQQVLPFTGFRPGGRQYNLQSRIDLKALGMEPGNELYFFIVASDNHRQETRSDVYIIRLEDTTVESGMDGMINGLDVKPDLFRSQRQIIIETEQLLQDKGKISLQAFQQRSDDLGVDQKLLRLRYGKFLGEETDTEIGDHEHDGADHHEGEAYTNNAAEIAEQFGHSHDNAEDATFFDAATKKQLKETLAEMWKAELQLRTFKPKEALVFEYKALRLLKDLQQKSRAYVAKTGFTPTPLKLEKRLTGELDKIGMPAVKQQVEKAASPEQAARMAIGELEQLKATGVVQPAQQTVLQQAFQQLSTKAAQAPSLYLPALAALQKVLSGRFRLWDIRAAQNGLQQMLAPPVRLPYASMSTSAEKLSDHYFQNLSGGGQKR